MSEDDAWLMAENCDWQITFHDGSTEAQSGTLYVHRGLMYIQTRTELSDRLYSLHVYPLTSVRKWEFVG